MDIEDLIIYQLSLELSKEVWRIVNVWDNFSKNTVGYQLVRAADSIPANISEGFGRFHFREEKQFLYYARGSLSETKTFITLAHSRNLINKVEYDKLLNLINTIGRKLNSFFKSIGKIND